MNLCNFPLCIDLNRKRVLLVGSGPETDEKKARLLPFQPELVCLDRLTVEDLTPRPAIVVIGDVEREEAEQYHALCMERHIPINVVDVPDLCTFYFPGIIKKGPLSIAISSGGASPAAVVYLREQIEAMLPEQTEEILDWLAEQRLQLRPVYPAKVFRKMIRSMTVKAFEEGRPLNEAETQEILAEIAAL